MGSIGPAELLVVFVVALLLFGAKRLPDIARGLGTGIREFKSAMREISSEMNIDDSRRTTPYHSPVTRSTTTQAAATLAAGTSHSREPVSAEDATVSPPVAGAPPNATADEIETV